MTAISLILLMSGVTPQDDKGAWNAVQGWLTDNLGMARPSDLMKEIKTPILLDKAHTGAVFVHYREFPVAMGPNPPLVQRNVFLVREGKAEHFKTRETLRKSFVQKLPALSLGDLEKASLEYALVSAHFSQDGFFQFLVDKKNVTLADKNGGKVVTAKIPVAEKGGDRGNLAVTLSYRQAQGKYKLHHIEEKDTIQAGVRPICQCTLLLDKNPIVRKMAERDLLVMGESAFPYMRSQLETASPELRKEIERVWKRIERGER